jgi:lipid-A-disaccharide synthase-like uncharacterized protein
MEEKVDDLEKDIESVKEDTKELKGSQKAQIWTLIGILGTALLGTVIRYIIIPFFLNHNNVQTMIYVII